MTAREMYFCEAPVKSRLGLSGKVGLMSVNVLEPVTVAKTLFDGDDSPPRPVTATRRTLSFIAAMPIAVTGQGPPQPEETNGAWLTTTMVSPLSVERYKRSLPK